MSPSHRIYFERILCPTDLSPDSDGGLRYAIALARAYGAKLFVVHCLESDSGVPGSDDEQIRRRLEAAVAKHTRLAGPNKLDWRPVVVEREPALAIISEAANRSIDLIVMRSRRRPYAAALLGSTAESICRAAPCPVLVTHQQEREWAGISSNEIEIKRVLVAQDFSGDSELALSYGLSFAEEFQAELDLIHVLEARPKSDVPELAHLPAGTESEFNQVARQLRNAVPAEAYLWCQVRHVLSQGQPYREILAYAEENEIDLICMGVHGTGFGMRALFGSNVDRVLRQAPCPVLIARPLRPANVAARSGLPSGAGKETRSSEKKTQLRSPTENSAQERTAVTGRTRHAEMRSNRKRAGVGPQ